MKHLELHIIQSVPVACLNRDDLNSPKTAVFGGVQRARVSSQSWKRAIREMAKELFPQQFRGERTRLMFDPLVKEMVAVGLSVADAEEGAKKIVDALVKLDTKSKEKVKSTTLYFMSPLELQTIAKVYVDTKDAKKTLKAIDAKSLKDAADISIFGRMVANDHSLTVEAASMFSHALSTHKVNNEIDFFSAVDDLQPKEESGAGMTGTLEFNSATYYRFAALNLDMLADAEHLGSMTREERQDVVRTFVEATVKAIPGARKNTMNGNTLPVYVLGVVREKGHPVQLVNAFENPIHSTQGYAVKSVELLKSEYAKLAETWGVEAVLEKAIPEVGMKTFLDEVVAHVN
ncbi:MAG: type I-E CRISPR-associated protein Cas7/Cse4/CasC [Desulfobulbaceae bacterium]|jgi:CRISPR system Cascade subunit CasC|nr:type I-E CRISPR-associated protein Cas7/Cse4/CasC [Desulfobulbaceae bacterium]